MASNETQPWVELLDSVVKADSRGAEDVYKMPPEDVRSAVTPIQKQDIVRFVGEDGSKLSSLEWLLGDGPVSVAVDDNPDLSQLNVLRIPGHTDEALAKAVEIENGRLYYFKYVHLLPSLAQRLAYIRASAKATSPLLFGGEGRSVMIPRTLEKMAANQMNAGVANPLDPPVLFYHVEVKPNETYASAIYVFHLREAVHHKGDGSGIATPLYNAGLGLYVPPKAIVCEQGDQVLLFYDAKRFQLDPIAAVVQTTRELLYIKEGSKDDLHRKFSAMAGTLPVGLYDTSTETIMHLVSAMNSHFLKKAPNGVPIRVAVASATPSYVTLEAPSLLPPPSSIKGNAAIGYKQFSQLGDHSSVDIINTSFSKSATGKEMYRQMRKLGLSSPLAQNNAFPIRAWIMAAYDRNIYDDGGATLHPDLVSYHETLLFEALRQATGPDPRKDWPAESTPLNLYVNEVLIQYDRAVQAERAWALLLKLKRMIARSDPVGIMVWCAMDNDPFFEMEDQLAASTIDFYNAHGFTSNSEFKTFSDHMKKIVDDSILLLQTKLGDAPCPSSVLARFTHSANAVGLDYLTMKYIRRFEMLPNPLQTAADPFDLDAIKKKFLMRSIVAKKLAELILFGVLDRILGSHISALDAELPNTALPSPDVLQEYVQSAHLGLWTRVSKANLKFLALDAANLPQPYGTHSEWSSDDIRTVPTLLATLSKPMIPHPHPTFKMPIYLFNDTSTSANKSRDGQQNYILTDLVNKHRLLDIQMPPDAKKKKTGPTSPSSPGSVLNYLEPSAPPEDFAPQNLKGLTALLMTRVNMRYRRYLNDPMLSVAAILSSWGLYKWTTLNDARMVALLRHHPSSVDDARGTRSPLQKTYGSASERFVRTMLFRVALARYVGSVDVDGLDKLIFNGRDGVRQRLLNNRRNFLPDPITFFAHRQAPDAMYGSYPSWRSNSQVGQDVETKIEAIYMSSASRDSLMPERVDAMSGELLYAMTAYNNGIPSTTSAISNINRILPRLQDATTQPSVPHRVIFVSSAEDRASSKQRLLAQMLTPDTLTALLWAGAMTINLEILMQYDLFIAVELVTHRGSDERIAAYMFNYVRSDRKTFKIDIEKAASIYNLPNTLLASSSLTTPPDNLMYAANLLRAYSEFTVATFFSGKESVADDGYALIKAILPRPV